MSRRRLQADLIKARFAKHTEVFDHVSENISTEKAAKFRLESRPDGPCLILIGGENLEPIYTLKRIDAGQEE